MAEQKSQPNPSKSHPNDSEPQIKKSMQDKPPNVQEDAKEPSYKVENGRVINTLDNSVVAEGEDEEELNQIAEQYNANPPAQDVEGNVAGNAPSVTGAGQR